MPGWEEGFDVCCISTVIASVRADAFSDVLFDRRNKVVQTQAIESEVCSLEAAGQGGHVERLGGLNLLSGNLVGPESVGFEGLSNAVGREVGVLPAVGAVAGLLAPVTVPGGCAVVSLSSVVVAFAVTSNEKEFVGSVSGGIAVEVLQESVEALPLG